MTTIANHQKAPRTTKQIYTSAAKTINKHGLSAVVKIDKFTKEYSLLVDKKDVEELSFVFDHITFSYNL